MPIKSGASMVTSRFDLEQEIERQFGQAGIMAAAKDDLTPGGPTDIEMRDDDAPVGFFSQPAFTKTQE